MGIHIDIVHFGVDLPFFGFVEESGCTQSDIRLVQLGFRCDPGIVRAVDRRENGCPVDILLEADAFIKRCSGAEESINIVIRAERHLKPAPVCHRLPFGFRSPTHTGLVVVDAD